MARDNRKPIEHVEPEGNTETPAPVPSKELAASSLPPLVQTIAGEDVSFPRQTMAGMVHTENSALAIDTLELRQFGNNETALASNRVKKLAAATTDEDRAKYAPWTAAKYVAKWLVYIWTGGGQDSGRMSASDSLRHKAAMAMWVKLVAAHNSQVGMPDGIATIAKAVMPGTSTPRHVNPPKNRPTKKDGMTKDQHKAEVEAWEANNLAFTTRLLSNADYAALIQVEIDRLQAEAGKAKAVAAPVEDAVDSADLI